MALKLTPFDQVAQPLHHGYRADALKGARVELVPLAEADYLFYCAWGDGPDVQHDMDKARSMGKPCIFHLTGDGCYVREDGHRYFTTALLPGCGVRQWQVPYHYPSQRIPDGHNDRDLLACFQGSFTTNRDREVLQVIASDRIHIEGAECWTAKGKHQERLWAEHHDLLLRSRFTLCPRGKGRSSIRVTEAMLRGSIPVLIDDGSRYFGDDMDFCVRIEYPDLWRLPDLLGSMPIEHRMDRKARMDRFVDRYLLGDLMLGLNTTLGHTEWMWAQL